MPNIAEWLNSHEEWIQNQISHYSHEFVFGHDLFFDPNDWIPIPEISQALITAIENPGRFHRELPLDGDFPETRADLPNGKISGDRPVPGTKSTPDLVAPLAKTYTQRSLQGGTHPALFLSMLKCYRRCYIKLIHSAGFAKSFTGYCHRRVADFFDRFEILSSIIWTKAGAVNSEAPLAAAPPADPVPALKAGIIDQLIEGITYEISQPLKNTFDNTLVLQKDFKALSNIFESFQDLLAALKTGEATPDMVLAVEREVQQAGLKAMLESIPALFQQLTEGVEGAARIAGAMKEFWRTRIDEDINININQVIENVLTLTRNKWKFIAGIQLELDPGLPAVLGLPGEFNQVILNLMVHSIHSIAKSLNSGAMSKGLIQITTGIAAGWIEIRIRNNGKPVWEMGTDPDTLDFAEIPDEQEREIIKRWLLSRETLMKKFRGRLEMEVDGKETVMVIRLPMKTES
ncbi:MAG: hypothetical protein K6U80_06150 [Firmicutes bacterium]|nr:hypothetical protein [Bacillota bacterium]